MPPEPTKHSFVSIGEQCCSVSILGVSVGQGHMQVVGACPPATLLAPSQAPPPALQLHLTSLHPATEATLVTVPPVSSSTIPGSYVVALCFPEHVMPPAHIPFSQR